MRSALFFITLISASGTCFAQQPAYPELVSFERHIVSILTKRGCNSSACHGGVKGKRRIQSLPRRSRSTRGLQMDR